MSTSPLEFAKRFARFKSELSRLVSQESRLLRMLQFWPELKPHTGETAYHSYIDEFAPLLVPLISENSFLDLSIEEVKTLSETLDSLTKAGADNEIARKLIDKRELVSLQLVKTLCYVGDFDQAIPICAEIAGLEGVDSVEKLSLPELDSFSALRVTIDTLECKSPEISRILEGVYSNWRGERESFYDDRVWSLFVEISNSGRTSRARLRRLVGSVRCDTKARDSSEPQDTVTFDNQLRAPNDPFVGVTYNSIDAVRKLLDTGAYAVRIPGSCQAFLGVRDSQQAFTGDSIGLSVAIITFVQFLSEEILKEKRLISSGAALTGGVDKDGNILPVNDTTIHSKIERAFFSPLKCLVLPDENLPVARHSVSKLMEQYPRRKLELIGRTGITDVIEDRNVISNQPVSLVEYSARKAYRLAKMARVQVPLLFILMYVLSILVYPPLSPFYDSDPDSVKLTETGFAVLNEDGDELWSADSICSAIDIESRHAVVDINGDGSNEVLFVPASAVTDTCANTAQLLVYDREGRPLFRRFCAPSDNPALGFVSAQFDFPANLYVARLAGKSTIVTTAQPRDRGLIFMKLWDDSGDSLGCYLNYGVVSAGVIERIYDGDTTLIFRGKHNPSESICLFALRRTGNRGTSPSHASVESESSDNQGGNQLFYILLPRSEVNRAAGCVYHTSKDLVVNPDGSLVLVTNEILDHCCVAGIGCHLYYVLDADFRVIEIQSSDGYTNSRSALIEDGRLITSLNLQASLDLQRDSVRYWTESGWVSGGQLRAIEIR